LAALPLELLLLLLLVVFAGQVPGEPTAWALTPVEFLQLLKSVAFLLKVMSAHCWGLG
jgi:hypothetical protein